jgi:hypothetical protein
MRHDRADANVQQSIEHDHHDARKTFLIAPTPSHYFARQKKYGCSARFRQSRRRRHVV